MPRPAFTDIKLDFKENVERHVAIMITRSTWAHLASCGRVCRRCCKLP